jgi:membrane protein implicated in regulation of membrane protease activity
MGILYIAALIIGLGVLSLSFFMGGDGDADGDGDIDAGDAGDVDVHADVDHADVGHGHGDVHGHADAGAIAIFLSLRFWTFGLLAFGLVGTILHFLHLAGGLVTPVAAALMGLGSGFLAAYTFRLLDRTQSTSGAEASDAIGQVGRVLVPIERGKRGKIRIEVRGQSVDLLASSDDERLRDGDQVVVEEIRGTTAHVSRATADFIPPKSR